MHWRRGICDKIMYEKFRKNHLQSGFHKRLANSIIKKYNITNLIFACCLKREEWLIKLIFFIFIDRDVDIFNYLN